jgi:hypothetical protein
MNERHPYLTAVDILKPGANEKIVELGEQSRLNQTPLDEAEQAALNGYVEAGQTFDDIMNRVKPEHMVRVSKFLRHIGQESEQGDNYIDRLR